MYDFDLIEDTSNRVYLKRLAIETCVNMIARTISQSEFRVKKGKDVVYDEFYYRMNVRPNKNQSASQFWQTVVHKLIHDNECLIIKSDSNDLLIADDFTRIEYGLVEDIFKDVTIKNYTFQRSFRASDVFYLQYSNEDVSRMITGLFSDYGELFGRMFEFQKYNNQIRSTVDLENVNSKDPETKRKLQKFIDDMYDAFRKKAFAIVPQQRGFVYEEKSNRASGASVDEINKVTNGFLDHLAKVMGIPPALIHGDMADVEKNTRNFMTFCIDPLLKKIKDEFGGKVIEKKDYLNGERMDIRRVSYRDIFDLASAVDKLRSGGIYNGNELREKLGDERVDEPILEEYVITKNYTETIEGGDKE
ncbi:phage portal protein, HK97 family [Salimicrobium album]|uniref:Phage portal protein, HK97 family n=2 Tax=Salimicrobium album TaxID=50717 RepID=A0A1H3DF73_9BACI|nr:phage portal protein, HK97 family [Salimicrobium album]